ncbi:MAG: OmpA family protein [Deltaproteobacteria bacterium]|nr:MAG: OmpA family protein [Deltaproteobacteria bacterium]
MNRRRLLGFVGCLLLSLFGCVTQTKYSQLEGTLSERQQELQRENEKLKNVELRMNYTEESRDKCFDRLSDFQARYKKVINENIQLARDMEDMKLDLEESESTIVEQSRVIWELNKTKERIETNMKRQIEAQEIKIEEIEGKLKVTFVDKILFDLGSVKINRRGQKALLKLANSLRQDRHQNITVEGHTDDLPIGDSLRGRFPTNWELSSARAIEVVRFLHETGQLEPERLSAVANSFYRPIASNDTAKGRRQNRRIEILLVPAR